MGYLLGIVNVLGNLNLKVGSSGKVDTKGVTTVVEGLSDGV